LLAALLTPLALFLGVELVLRLGRYGYDTHFLQHLRQENQNLLVPNPRFGWRFFGPEVSRWPYPFAIPERKATNVVRILVFGESAARGEPQPEFGLPRVLEAMLNLRVPTVRFEVVNVAMTAINSHVILPIARDCARAEGDIWVIYMGNNEVVGPFGAGTIFGSQTPPLPLIRANLALKSTRVGQLVDATFRNVGKRSDSADSNWGGMGMFLEQQVPASDARMAAVYHHFAANLTKIIRTGERAGAGIVLSTVAVNLKDCAPFASDHRLDLSPSELAEWQKAFEAGCQAYEAGQFPEAQTNFNLAATIDDTYAELCFRQAMCALALGQVPAAHTAFEQARDLDTLRFRCDSRLNQIIRETAEQLAGPRLGFVDAEQSFATQSSNSVPGNEFFYEHVHLNFAGNYLLARLIAEQVVPLLPAWARDQVPAHGPWPTEAECAQRLGHSLWHEVAGWRSILSTVKEPPFTSQLNHRTLLRQLESHYEKLTRELTVQRLAACAEISAQAVAANPTDAILHYQLGVLQRAQSNLVAAITSVRQELALLPNDPAGWTLLGEILMQTRDFTAAEAAFRRSFALGPQGAKSRLVLAKMLAAVGKSEQSLAEYHDFLRHYPTSIPALLQVGQLLETFGRTNEAAGYFQQAFENRRQREPELVELGEFFLRRREHAMALTCFTEALQQNPDEFELQFAAGRCLASLGRYEEASRYTSEAIRLSPERPEAHQIHGIVLSKRGLTADAITEFQEVLRLQPRSREAELNLGVACFQAGRMEDARSSFDRVLAQDPTNAMALQYLHKLSGPGPKP